MKKYDDNIPLLKNRVETHAFIRNISKHRLPDGTLDVEGNLKLWSDGMQGFVKTPLWEKTPGWREDTHLQGEPYLVFVPGNSGSPTILIAHGGGFSWRTGCEGPNVAWYFHQAGYNTAILSYRLLPYDRYASMADMQRAIRLLRARKEEFGIGEKIVVMGFSAGGMICGNCATHFDNGSQTAPDLVQHMLGCHDGIPLLDLRGLLPEERIAGLIDLIIARGGFVKNLHGQKNVYYQVNATYYSALGEDDRKMLVARAVQLFMPGKPQVWYLDLFAGKNDHEAVAKAGEGGHKEINRTNLTVEQIHSALTQDVVKKQIELLRFRKSSRAFTSNAKISVISNKNNMHFIWQGNTTAELSVDFTTMSYEVKENGYIMMKG